MLKRFPSKAQSSKSPRDRQKLSFSKDKRLVRERQFKSVLARNLRFSDGLLTLYIAENDCGYSRLGVSVGKSCGKAFVRNRLKRLLREAFRRNQEQIPPGLDYLLMISPSSTERGKSADSRSNAKGNLRKLTFQQVNDSFLALVAAVVKKIG